MGKARSWMQRARSALLTDFVIAIFLVVLIRSVF